MLYGGTRGFDFLIEIEKISISNGYQTFEKSALKVFYGKQGNCLQLLPQSSIMDVS